MRCANGPVLSVGDSNTARGYAAKFLPLFCDSVVAISALGPRHLVVLVWLVVLGLRPGKSTK